MDGLVAGDAGRDSDLPDETAENHGAAGMEGVNFSSPYAVFTGVLIVLSVLERVQRNHALRKAFFRFCCIGCYLFFIGLRGYIGTDWYSYRLIFEQVPTLFSGGWTGFWEENLLEPGFVVFTSTVKSVWNDYHLFVFVNACLDMAILHAFLKRYVDWYTLGLLLFFVMGGLTLCELMRNMRGIGLFLLSLKALSERRPVTYFGLNGLGMLFHISSIVYLPLYWLLRRNWPKWIFFTVFLTGNLIFLCRIEWIRPGIAWITELLGGRFAHLQAQYLLNDLFDERYRVSIGYLERLVSSALILGFYRKLICRKESNVLFVNAYLLYFAFFFFFSEIREFSARFSLLFIFAYWVIVPELYEILKVKFNRTVLLCAVYSYCLLKISSMTATPLYRYDNLLWGIESYGRRADIFDRYYLNR